MWLNYVPLLLSTPLTFGCLNLVPRAFSLTEKGPGNEVVVGQGIRVRAHYNTTRTIISTTLRNIAMATSALAPLPTLSLVSNLTCASLG